MTDSSLQCLGWSLDVGRTAYIGCKFPFQDYESVSPIVRLKPFTAFCRLTSVPRMHRSEKACISSSRSAASGTRTYTSMSKLRRPLGVQYLPHGDSSSCRSPVSLMNTHPTGTSFSTARLYVYVREGYKRSSDMSPSITNIFIRFLHPPHHHFNTQHFLFHTPTHHITHNAFH